MSAATWRSTSAPAATSRYDDIYFLDPATGWAVNGNGQILSTTDSGLSWQLRFQTPVIGKRPVYLRCVGFANETTGWVGTLTKEARLYATNDGGATWRVVELPPQAPPKVCGLSVVDADTVYCSGTNEPADRAPAMTKTTDGGATWTAWSMADHAAALIDVHFFNGDNGFVVGGRSTTGSVKRTDLRPVVLETQDGGQTWVDRVADLDLPLGEWGWKLHFIDRQRGFVSLENFTDGAILSTVDGGMTWQRLPINDSQGNQNLEGVGFLNDQVGWVGGWGDADFMTGSTSGTVDGGRTWTDANDVGSFINRFRFFADREDVGFACGKTVYKMSTEPAVRDMPPPEVADPTHAKVRAENGQLAIDYVVPEGTQQLWLHIWDRFGGFVRTVSAQEHPTAGPATAVWDGCDDDGAAVPAGPYLYRLSLDDVRSGGLFTLRQ